MLDASLMTPAHISPFPTAPDPAGPDQMLVLRNITKTFPGVVANDHVTLEVRAGQLHALLGETGAGKTTLMSILYGT